MQNSTQNRSLKILGAIAGVAVCGAAVISTGNNIWYALMLFCAYVAIINGYRAIQDTDKQVGRPSHRQHQHHHQHQKVAQAPIPEYYDVPFAKKDRAKALGLRWHRESKKWFLPKTTPWTNKITFQEEFKRLAN
jgi:hypothetical protein